MYNLKQTESDENTLPLIIMQSRFSGQPHKVRELYEGDGDFYKNLSCFHSFLPCGQIDGWTVIYSDNGKTGLVGV